jgi:hypothetical protein
MASQVKHLLLSWVLATALLSFNPAPALAKPEPLPKSKPVKVSRVRIDTSASRAYAMTFMSDNYGWGSDEFACLEPLWNAESGWNHRAHNRSSGAFGIPQSLPGHKMASAGSDWRTNPQTQIRWGLSYIQHRYQTPCGAYAHFKKRNWY